MGITVYRGYGIYVYTDYAIIPTTRKKCRRAALLKLLARTRLPQAFEPEHFTGQTDDRPRIRPL